MSQKKNSKKKNLLIAQFEQNKHSIILPEKIPSTKMKNKNQTND